jgi:dTDP-4-dehydrorhamnose reductase
MKVLLTGAQGQLGQTLQAQRPRDMVIASVDLPGLDITDRQDVLARVELEKPDIIVNCAAYTAVDHAESERELATSVNGDGPKNLAIAAREHGARLIHISTDFVFDGHTSKPYLPDAPAHPLSVYGASKWRGEQWVRDILPDRSIILRTSWLYGEYGGNFVSTMLNLFEERDRISVVDDQTGTPTWARSLVKAIFGFVLAPFRRRQWTWGLSQRRLIYCRYHLANTGR